MSTPTVPANPGAELPPDERLRQEGIKVMTALSAAVRTGRAYDPRNQVFAKQLDNLLGALKPMFETGVPVVMLAHADDLYLNNVRVPVTEMNFKRQQTVLEMLRRLDVGGIRFEPDAGVPDLSRFFEICFRPDGPKGQDLLTACAAQGLTAVTLVLGGAVDPSRTPPEGSGAPEAGAPASGERVHDGREEPAEVRAWRRQMLALQGTKLLLMPSAMQGSLEVRHAKRVVLPLIEGATLAEPVLVGHVSASRPEEYVYEHAVSVCAIAVATGYFLGLDRRSLSDLGVAALLHDVGKHEVASRITNDLERFTPEERATAERHTLEGARLIARTTSLNPTTLSCLRVALEHHGAGEQGYPALPSGWTPSTLSQIVAVADCFVSLQCRLSQVAPSVSPHEALGMMLGPYGDRFERAMLWALVRAVGIYPYGQIVELDDGSMARVLAPNLEDPEHPSLRVIAAADGTRLPAEQQTEFRPLPLQRSVRRALKLREVPKDLDSENRLEAVA